MYVLLSIWYWKSIELMIKSTLILSTYKNISCQKSHLLVLSFVKLILALQFTSASKSNTFNSRWMFQLDSITCFTWGVTKHFQKFLSTIMNNLLKFYWNPTKFLMQSRHYSIIDSANLGIRSRGRLFLNRLMSAMKKKNIKKFGQILEPCILETAGPISLKFDM